MLLRGAILLLAILYLSLALGPTRLTAQEVQVEAPTVVPAGEPFRVIYYLHEKVLGHTAPLWGKIICLSGPNVGSSRSVQIINGKMTQEVSYQYEYICQIDQPGVYSIPAAEFKLSQGTVKSEPVEIEVVDSPSRGGGGTGQRQPQRDGNPSASQGEVAENLFVRMEVNRAEVYQSEPIVATLKIYSRWNLLSFEDFHFPDFKGFWSKEIATPRSINFSKEAVNGREYQAGILRQMLLYPQKSGELTIDPFEAQVLYQIPSNRRSIFDPFFGGGYETLTASVKSKSVKIRVKELPKGKPQGFSGGVGSFTIESRVDTDSVLTNQAVTYTLEVKGKGNLQLLTTPEIAFPSTLETFPPKVIEKYSVSGGAQQGSVIYQYILIPRAPGRIEIPPVEYAYFDPQTGAYRTIKEKGLPLQVTADTTSKATAMVNQPTVGKEDIQYLGTDIRHIQRRMPKLRPIGKRYLGTTLWWATLLGLLTLAMGTWLYLLRHRSLQANARKARQLKANRIAQKRLKEAKRLQGGADSPFYRELLNALWGYLSDKLSIGQADLTTSNVRQLLEARGLSPEIIDQLLQTIEHCEYAQFAPDPDRSRQQSELYQEVYNTITQLNGAMRG